LAKPLAEHFPNAQKVTQNLDQPMLNDWLLNLVETIQQMWY
jgi:hypothetical protein